MQWVSCVILLLVLTLAILGSCFGRILGETQIALLSWYAPTMNEQLPAKGDYFCKSPVSCSGFSFCFNGGVFVGVLKTPTLSDVLALFVYLLLWKRFTSVHVVWQLRCSILSFVRISVSLLTHSLQSVSLNLYLCFYTIYIYIYMICLGLWINHFLDVRMLYCSAVVAWNHWTLASIGSKSSAPTPRFPPPGCYYIILPDPIPNQPKNRKPFYPVGNIFI